MKTADDLTCQELVELVTDYFEGALPPVERARFEAHRGGCRGCNTYLEQMRQTIRLTGTLTEETLAPETKEALLGIFRNWNKQ
jgi:hypothetical protein